MRCWLFVNSAATRPAVCQCLYVCHNFHHHQHDHQRRHQHHHVACVGASACMGTVLVHTQMTRAAATHNDTTETHAPTPPHAHAHTHTHTHTHTQRPHQKRTAVSAASLMHLYCGDALNAPNLTVNVVYAAAVVRTVPGGGTRDSTHTTTRRRVENHAIHRKQGHRGGLGKRPPPTNTHTPIRHLPHPAAPSR